MLRRRSSLAKVTGYLQKTASAFIKQAQKLPKEVHYVSSGPDPSVRRQVHEIGQKADPHKKGRLPATFQIQRCERIKRQPKRTRSVCGDTP